VSSKPSPVAFHRESDRELPAGWHVVVPVPVALFDVTTASESGHAHLRPRRRCPSRSGGPWQCPRTPSVDGGEIGQLVAEGLLHPECVRIFRVGKTADGAPGKSLLLHRHQDDAIWIAKRRESYVLNLLRGCSEPLGRTLFGLTELAINCRLLANGASGIEFQCNRIEPRSAASMALCLS
jgi:hypothetical protein